MKKKWVSVLLAAAMVTGSVVPTTSVFAEDDFADVTVEENADADISEDISVEDETEEDQSADVDIADDEAEVVSDEAEEAGADLFGDGESENDLPDVQSLGENQVALPDYIFGDTWNKSYDVLYHEKNKEYLYNGQVVEFPDSSTVKVGDKTYDIYNREIEVEVKTDESGKTLVSLTNLSAAVYQISGSWNASFGGTIYAAYKTDIAGKENVTFGSLTSAASTATLTLDGIASGTYHLNSGVIYEKANKWSPGFDFKDGKGTVTERNFGYLPDITITVQGTGEDEPDSYLGVNAGSEVPDSFQNDLWTQYDFKEMKVGDKAKLIPRRVEEAITNAISNDVQLPHFNYEIIKGDSVTLDETDNSKVIVTAKKKGNTVVKITYDALEHSAGKHFDACDPVNTAYVVYSVGGNENISITDNIVYKDADKKDAADVVFRSYDTVYFTDGNTTPFTLKASAEGAEKVTVKCNGITVNGTDGTYTLPLENRSNIIEITATASDGTTRSKFHVLDARKIKVNVENETHEGAILEAGDTAKISFTGITMPVYKLATIYNPQFNSPSWGSESTYVHYKYGSTVYKGHCTQWDLAIKNSFEVTFPEAGEYKFEDGRIYCAWWGSVLGSDKTQDNPGLPNTNAPTLEDDFSFMPDFTVNVAEGTSVAVESVALDKTELQMNIDETAQLTATVTPENATYKDVKWSSSNEGVATVDANGLVTAVAEGQADIKATADDKEVVCKVTVKPEKDITAAVTPEKIYDGDTVTVKFDSIKVPKEVKSEKNVWEQYTGYETDISGIKSIKGTSDDLNTISFTVPEGTPSGTYTLKNGYYYAHFGGAQVQGYFLVGDTEKKFYEDKMPEIKINIVNREEEQKEIQKLRDDAGSKLDASVNYDNYKEEQQEVIKEIIESAKNKINNLESEEEIAAVVKKAQRQIASVKTADQVTASELKTVKSDSRKELEGYKDLKEYRDAQKKELETIIIKAKLAISDAASEKEIKDILTAAKAQMDKVVTDKELTVKENQAKQATDKTVLRMRVTTSKTAAKLSWNRIPSATGYKIYGSRCNGKAAKYLATVNANTLTWKQSKLKKATNYKYYVVAYKVVNGKEVTITKSDSMHAVTTGGKYGNAKKVTVNKTNVSVNTGKTYTLKVKVTNTKKAVKNHVSAVRYKVSDSTVATVNKNGTIKGLKKGTCYVYCYAANGAYKTVKVTVK